MPYEIIRSYTNFSFDIFSMYGPHFFRCGKKFYICLPMELQNSLDGLFYGFGLC